ncbi:MAG: PTS sugar transporter subunit IIA [Candidatus Delongbacteria bacterium]
MDISEYIKPELIEIRSGHPTKDEVLTDISELAVKNIGKDKVSIRKVYRKLKDREDLGTTGFGNNIAIPHCALSEIDDFVIGFLLYPDGAEFESMDEKPVKFFAFILAPEKKRNLHIRFLSEISGVLKHPEAVDLLFSQPNSVSVRENFLKYALPFSEDRKHKEEYMQLRIFCQNEKKFYEILKLLNSIKERDVSVIEGSDPKDYTSTKAFFGKIFSEKKTKFHKIIFAVLPSEYANDVVRKINNIIGTLPGRKGVMLILQKIEYINGYLKN